MNKLLIISHTAHYKNANGAIVGWGPTITEVNYLSQIFDEIYHAAPLHKGVAPKSAIAYLPSIHFIALKPSGGKGLRKFSIISQIPYNLKQIKKCVHQVTIIQFRAPTGIGLYVLPWLRFVNKTEYWVKYAGNWGADILPLGNRFQRWWLKNMLNINTKVTINGVWKGDKKNIISFENPCLTENDREEGSKLIISKKLATPYNFCFIGGLNNNKGISLVIDAFCEINQPNLGTLHIVGDGVLKDELKIKAKKIKTPVIFHGYLSKSSIIEIYKNCHFIILPSKSEGFPKVIGEAMNFGCIPIVSDISCIGQYIKNNNNGFLLESITKEALLKSITQSCNLELKVYRKYIISNYNIAEKFTYLYYLNRIQKEILTDVRITI